MVALRGIIYMVSEDYRVVRHCHGIVCGGDEAGVIWDPGTGSLAERKKEVDEVGNLFLYI